jgi:ankyrin repeat protein
LPGESSTVWRTASAPTKSFATSTLPPGEDFRASIRRRIEGSQILLALIGPRWLSAAGASGRRRLDDEQDLVRLEIAAALARELRVIPVLLHGAAMPRASELPAELTPLASRNAFEVRDTSFDDDVERLVRALMPAPYGRWIRTLTRPAFLAASAALAALIAVLGYPYLVTSPEKARTELARLGLEFDATSFVRQAADGDGKAVELYLRAGMPPDAPDRRNDTALMWAASRGHIDVVRRLVAKGADLNGALSWAVGQPAVLEYLLTRKPAGDAIDAALVSASRHYVAAMQRLLEAGANVNAKIDGATALTSAARMLNVEGARLLLARGAEVNPELEHGWLPLHHAIDPNNASEGERENERLALTQALVGHGANLEARTRSMASWQPTPLLLAIDERLPAVARFLIERGADVNVRTRNASNRERTALMWAAEEGLPTIVEALLARGAAVDARNDEGETALIVAAEGSREFGRNQPAVVRMLLAAGADVDATTSKGGAVLTRAASQENGVLALLVERGVDVNKRNPGGWTALGVAAYYDRSENVRLLLDRGADPKLTNADGDDALAVAIKENSRRAAALLRPHFAATTGRRN